MSGIETHVLVCIAGCIRFLQHPGLSSSFPPKSIYQLFSRLWGFQRRYDASNKKKTWFNSLLALTGRVCVSGIIISFFVVASHAGAPPIVSFPNLFSSTNLFFFATRTDHSEQGNKQRKKER